MNTIDFLDNLKSANIKLYLDGNKLKCSAEKGVLTETTKSEISRRKSDIIDFLSSVQYQPKEEPHQTSQTTTLSQVEISAEDTPPLIISPEKNVTKSLVAWSRQNTQFIEQQLLKHGAILFRGFALEGVEEFEKFIIETSEEPMPYSASAVGMKRRPSILRNIVEPIDVVNAKDPIPQHNECTFADVWPAKIYFCCLQEPQTGGQTPIADARRILKRIPESILKRFQEKKILYIRHFNNGQWQKTFEVDSKTEVARMCANSDAEIEWLSGDCLRIKSTRQAVLEHKITGDKVWFNHVYPANIASLNPETRSALLDMFDLDRLPRNTYYGDGEVIETSVLQKIHQAYEQEKIKFDWQKNDVLMLDNMLFTHGREPFTPPRRIAVAMSQPIKLSLYKQ